jgi:glutamyl-tRNA(Gln) amidotransferase subunit E
MNRNDEEGKFRELDLKIGLEIHRQLDTKKLFCNCSSELTEDFHGEFIRMLRPTQSELGKVDIAALEEVKKRHRFIYKVAPNVCLVETDEEPPHEVNPEALDIVLTVALLFDANIVDEIQFMRKIVIDGSNTAGFQRTALIATDGFIEVDGKRIDIASICLEEDAARKLEDKEDSVVYALDRLGIPLVEISTKPDIRTPAEAKAVAEKIGNVLRATRKVKRGIGTVRQDINISIKGGARIEIKGFQELNSIPFIIHDEIVRQLNLISVADELKKRGINKDDINIQIIDILPVFKDTKSKLLSKIVDNKGAILGAKLDGFAGAIGSEIFQKNISKFSKYNASEKLEEKRLGQELSQYAKVCGVSGILHSDELPAYGITKEEVSAIRKTLHCEENDAFIIVAGKKENCRSAIQNTISRARLACEGVPEEVRKALSSSTEYMRPIPGAARMYPETDIPPNRVRKEKIDYLRADPPKSLEEQAEDLSKKYFIPTTTATTIISKELDEDFIEYVDIVTKGNIKVIPTASSICSRVLLNIVPEIENNTKMEVKRSQIEDVLRLYYNGKISKEGIPLVLQDMVIKNLTAEEAASKLGIISVSIDEVERTISEIVENNTTLINSKGMDAVGPLMGDAMAKLRGKVDGKTINSILRKKIEEKIKKDKNKTNN